MTSEEKRRRHADYMRDWRKKLAVEDPAAYQRLLEYDRERNKRRAGTEANRARGKRYNDKMKNDPAWIAKRREQKRRSDAKLKLLHPEYRKNQWQSWHIRTLYGLDWETYQRMIAEQDNCCAICKEQQPGGKFRLAIDHCHETGRIRGLLCNRCNGGLGLFKDNTDTMRLAIEYVEKHRQLVAVPLEEKVS